MSEVITCPNCSCHIAVENRIMAISSIGPNVLPMNTGKTGKKFIRALTVADKAEILNCKNTLEAKRALAQKLGLGICQISAVWAHRARGHYNRVLSGKITQKVERVAKEVKKVKEVPVVEKVNMKCIHVLGAKEGYRTKKFRVIVTIKGVKKDRLVPTLEQAIITRDLFKAGKDVPRFDRPLSPSTTVLTEASIVHPAHGKGKSLFQRIYGRNIMATTELVTNLHEAVGRLSANLKSAIELKYEKGMVAEEIGNVLNIPRVHFNYRLKDAVKHLKHVLTKSEMKLAA